MIKEMPAIIMPLLFIGFITNGDIDYERKSSLQLSSPTISMRLKWLSLPKNILDIFKN